MNLVFNESEKEFIRENYGKISYPEMAKRINRDWMDIRHCATKMGIRTKGRAKSKFAGRKACAVNENFFDTPNKLNCYWAGFLAADGNITEVSESQKRLTLKLAEKDADHIEKFKKDIAYQGNLYSDASKLFYKGEIKVHPQKLIKISNVKIVSDLNSVFNLTSRKTFTLKFPELQDEQLIDFFIVGYVDGDGYIRKKGKAIEFVVLGNELFLNSMARRLSEICGENIKVSLKQAGAKIHKICICGIRAKKIFQHLYPIAKKVGALERKWREEYLTKESSNI